MKTKFDSKDYINMFLCILFLFFVGFPKVMLFYVMNDNISEKIASEETKQAYALMKKEKQEQLKEFKEKEIEKNKTPRIVKVGKVIDDTDVIFLGFSDNESDVVVLKSVNHRTPHFYNIKKENSIDMNGFIFEFGKNNKANTLEIISTKKALNNE